MYADLMQSTFETTLSNAQSYIDASVLAEIVTYIDASLLAEAVLGFFAYSVFGWIFEIVYCSATEGHLVKRGFLSGPYCPIYGVGALADLAVLGSVQDAVALFCLGAVLASAIEYVTSYGMERAFGARWWDYSNLPFNLNGRISVPSACAFGLFAVVLVKVTNPAMTAAFATIPDETLCFVAAITSVIFFCDFAHILVVRLKPQVVRLKPQVLGLKPQVQAQVQAWAQDHNFPPHHTWHS